MYTALNYILLVIIKGKNINIKLICKNNKKILNFYGANTYVKNKNKNKIYYKYDVIIKIMMYTPNHPNINNI